MNYEAYGVEKSIYHIYNRKTGKNGLKQLAKIAFVDERGQRNTIFCASRKLLSQLPVATRSSFGKRLVFELGSNYSSVFINGFNELVYSDIKINLLA